VKFLIHIILFFCVSWQTLHAQTKDELKITTKKEVKDSINPLAPSKAAFYSALLPGLGQAYNKKYWKIPIVFAAIGTGIYFIVDNNTKYTSYRNEYKARLLGTNNTADPNFGRLSTESVIRGQKFYQKNRDLSILITAGLYILNIIDANVDAHLLQYNVNDDLTLKPQINQNFLTNKHEVGLCLSYQF